jgi:hypothetical protein
MYQKIKSGVLQFFILGIVAVTLSFISTNIPHSFSRAGAAPLPQTTADHLIFLPLIYRQPTPTLSPVLYYDNFTNTGSGWRQSTSGSCLAIYTEHVYGTFTQTDQHCYWPAPHKAKYTYGTFEVQARQIELVDSKSTRFRYGLYINHNSSGYYLFWVELNKKNDDCRWQLIRQTRNKKTWGGNCKSASHKYNRFNTLKIQHVNSGEISVYLNGNLLGSYTDKAQLTGKGAGLYIREESEDGGVIISFDNFTVYRP